ncbi:MAG: uracil-DNA glycosylase [Anaerolineae bacterium]|nr:uracil-DNA glycosylase [Anaerolineae bacterium]MDK1081229.1 uracil-DNA glycosylase [Anaerolineae bacterium]MDK1117564.1 uracil-DNA glycosylase [Anaerolineae bacterium]
MSQFDMFNMEESLPQFDSLDILFESMMSMTDDPLANAGTNVVISRGNPDAKIIIVGEAPGPQENIQGVPFVGRAGQLLDKILAASDFDSKKDIFITNSVFRMPPGEDGKSFRKPTNDEIHYYRPYVAEIIRLIDPHIILLTGNVACQSFLDKTGITKLRGQWTASNNRWIMPIFHPSYLLRNPSKNPGSPKSLMWDDIREVRKKYDQLTSL